MTVPTECAVCGRELHSRTQARHDGGRCKNCHEAGGLCARCYYADKRGAHGRERVQHDSNVILENYDFLRSHGASREECVARLGLTVDSLAKVLERAGKRGDPRSDWAPRTRLGQEREDVRSWPDERVMALKGACDREWRAGRVPSDVMFAARQEYEARLRARRRREGAA